MIDVELNTALAAYAAGAGLTFLFLLMNGRRGTYHRGRQFAVSLVWPIYWIVIQRFRGTVRALTRLIVLLSLVVMTPLIALSFVYVSCWVYLSGSRRGA